MNFNKGEFTKLREDMKAVLAGLEEKYHLDFEFGSITYGEYEFKMKVSAKKTDIGMFARLILNENAEHMDFHQKITREK